MNFLAHIYLSGEDDFVKIGNFMADGIRGKEFEKYPPRVQKGIILHRAIDTYTDAHPVFRKSTQRLHANYHHYAGVIVDIFYDHFLAKNWNLFSDEPLQQFVERFYQSLRDNPEVLSQKTKQIMPYMIEQNWLYNYQSTDGIGRILAQMDQRTGNVSKMRLSINDLLEHYDKFEKEFMDFFEDIQAFVSQRQSA